VRAIRERARGPLQGCASFDSEPPLAPPAHHLATIFAGVKAAYPQTSWSFLDMQVMTPCPPPHTFPPHCGARPSRRRRRENGWWLYGRGGRWLTKLRRSLLLTSSTSSPRRRVARAAGGRSLLLRPGVRHGRPLPLRLRLGGARRGARAAGVFDRQAVIFYDDSMEAIT
jgi:hypothetical protein